MLVAIVDGGVGPIINTAEFARRRDCDWGLVQKSTRPSLRGGAIAIGGGVLVAIVDGGVGPIINTAEFARRRDCTRIIRGSRLHADQEWARDLLFFLHPHKFILYKSGPD